jgi:hypothetical protein
MICQARGILPGTCHLQQTWGGGRGCGRIVNRLSGSRCLSREENKPKQSSPVVTPVIKSGHYTVAKGSTTTLHPLHNHVHKRVILDAALDLNRDNPITSFTNGLCVLINNTKLVNEHFVVCSFKGGGSKMWRCWRGKTRHDKYISKLWSTHD